MMRALSGSKHTLEEPGRFETVHAKDPWPLILLKVDNGYLSGFLFGNLTYFTIARKPHYLP